MTPCILRLALIAPLIALPGCNPLPKLGIGGPPTGPTPALLPASALPAPITTAAPTGSLDAEAAALQARANALRNP
ncbi:hypothetical protein [Fuscibacter oryzae]|uniref:Uncharacterized protein n=1 Tax=Fuscibacter oryzae TaxID=2803939 RepID=A0A8J7MRR2_9RHOB|nr:hypothetical protein [Fuscibacter oryzae]MBL4927158.1 hypothetical protein [Fuscibacter oryzae]